MVRENISTNHAHEIKSFIRLLPVSFLIALLRGVSIRNFRGISKGEVTDLNQINVFVGKGNSGKSTFLDALYFLKAPLMPTNELHQKTLLHLLNRRAPRESYNIDRFWYARDTTNLIKLTLTFDQASILFKCSKTDDALRYDCSESLPTAHGALCHFDLSLRDENVSYTILDRSESTSSGIAEVIRSEVESHLLVPDLETAEFYHGFCDDVRFLSNLVLIDETLSKNISGVEKHVVVEILKGERDETLRKILNRSYGLEIESIAFLPSKAGTFKLYLKTPAASLDFDDFGDGFRISFCVVSLAMGLSNTALLWEEPESHQDLDALNSIFQYLIKVADRNNLQLFFTTHDKDVIRILSNLTQDRLKIFSLQLDHEGRLLCNRIYASDATKFVS